jgi:hypothetical protein
LSAKPLGVDIVNAAGTLTNRMIAQNTACGPDGARPGALCGGKQVPFPIHSGSCDVVASKPDGMGDLF